MSDDQFRFTRNVKIDTIEDDETQSYEKDDFILGDTPSDTVDEQIFQPRLSRNAINVKYKRKVSPA